MVTMGAGLVTISVYKKMYKARACCAVMPSIDKYGQCWQSVFTIFWLLMPQTVALVSVSFLDWFRRRRHLDLEIDRVERIGSTGLKIDRLDVSRFC